MYSINRFDLPRELYEQPLSQINIIVGENGSGKSSLLRDLSSHFVNQHSKVIAIANTVHDKFTVRHQLIESLKASSGKSIVRSTLKRAILNILQEDNGGFKRAASALSYVNFDPVFAIKIIGLKYHFQDFLKYASIDDDTRELIISLLEQYQYGISRSDGLLVVELYQDNFVNFTGAGTLEILKFEKLLKKLKVIREIEVYLMRNEKFMIANKGSSGELTLITTFIFLIVTVNHGAKILIDEPENSLHPKWQTEYVKTLYDLVYRYEPTIYIATHSPLIVNSSKIELGNRISIFKGEHHSFNRVESESIGVEEVYQDVFDLTTPENRFLSEYMAKKMNQLAAGKISLDAFNHLTRDLQENAYDPRQQEVLEGILELASRIVISRN
jgi:predicted ATPase